MGMNKTVIVTGGSQGIGAGLVTGFLEKGYSVVATSRTITKSNAFRPNDRLAMVDGNIGDKATATAVVEAAISKFSSIDALVQNAGIFFTKPFTDYTTEDFRRLTETNLDGFIYLSQLAIKQMLKQKAGGSVVTITASQAGHPIAGLTASVPMITKGGLESISKSLAMEYSKEGIRVNTVAPGIVDTPLTRDFPRDFLKTLSPMGRICDVQDVVDAVLYLTEAMSVTGETLRVDGGAHVGKW